MMWHNTEESNRERLEQKIISHYGDVNIIK
jgi:hypothetical protein